MPKSALILGGVPFNRARSDGRYLTAASFKSNGGKVPVCWLHWIEDDHLFSHKAVWFLTADCIAVMHNLDLRQPHELKIYELARAGKVYLSHGHNKTPEETRAAIAGRLRFGESLRRSVALKNEPLGHFAFCLAPAFEQKPVKVW